MAEGEEERRRVSVGAIHELAGHEGSVWGVDWHPAGGRLASCGQDLVIRIWSRGETGWHLTDELRNAHTRTVRSVAFSPDGRRLAAAGFEGVVSVWTAREGGGWTCVANLEGHENEVKSVAWSSDGRLLASCGRDKTVWIWELDAGEDGGGARDTARTKDDDPEFECLAVLAEHTQDVKMVRFHPYDSRTLVSASYDDSVRVWRADAADDGEWLCAQTLTDHRSTVWAVDFSDRGRNLISVSDDRSINLYQRRDDSSSLFVKIHTLPDAHRRPIYGVSWLQRASSSDCDEDQRLGGSDPASLAATFGGDRCVRFWHVDPQVPCIREAGCLETEGRTEVNCVRWSPCPVSAGASALLAVAGDGGYLRVVSVG